MNQLAARCVQYVGSLVCCVAALAAGATCDAEVIGSMTLMRDPSIGLPFTSPDAALPAPWVSYAITVSTTDDNPLQALEVNINGQLHQRWTDPNGGGAYAATNTSTNKSDGDSHLLALPSMLFASDPTETNPGTDSPLSVDNDSTNKYGVGTDLAGTFGLPGRPATYFEAAYIVIPKGSEDSLAINVGLLFPTGEWYFTREHFVLTQPTAQVMGAGIVISNGDTTPRSEDNTDYGVDPVGVAEIRTFVLENTSTVPLSLGIPTFSGPFSLASTLPPTINPGGSTSFNVRMTRDSPGNFLGSMSFASNSGPYTFALAGRAVPEPSSWALSSLCLVSWAVLRRR